MRKKQQMEKHYASAEELRNYLSETAKRHNHYKFYAKNPEYVRCILEDRFLYLNNGDKWNDSNDKNNLQCNEDKQYYVKCFSYAADENVAMWMLYGGIYHKGVMIDFTKKAMGGILKVPKVELGYFEDGVFHSQKTIERPKFEIWLTDIVYSNEKTRYLKRSDENCYGVSPQVFAGLGYCKKSYPWSYESECRLMVSVNKNEVPEKCTDIRIDLSTVDMGKTLQRVYMCPSYEGKKLKGFKESALGNTVTWELLDEECQKCKDKKCSKCTNEECQKCQNREKGDQNS